MIYFITTGTSLSNSSMCWLTDNEVENGKRKQRAREVENFDKLKEVQELVDAAVRFQNEGDEGATGGLGIVKYLFGRGRAVAEKIVVDGHKDPRESGREVVEQYLDLNLSLIHI